MDRFVIILNQMVKYNDKQLDQIFRALADPTRRAIMQRLIQGDALVTDLARPFDMSLPAITKHLNVLESAGLLQREKRGRERHCSLNPEPLRQVAGWIEVYRYFWEQRLDKLAQLFEAREKPKPKLKGKKYERSHK